MAIIVRIITKFSLSCLFLAVLWSSALPYHYNDLPYHTWWKEAPRYPDWCCPLEWTNMVQGEELPKDRINAGTFMNRDFAFSRSVLYFIHISSISSIFHPFHPYFIHFIHISSISSIFHHSCQIIQSKRGAIYIWNLWKCIESNPYSNQSKSVPSGLVHSEIFQRSSTKK